MTFLEVAQNVGYLGSAVAAFFAIRKLAKWGWRKMRRTRVPPVIPPPVIVVPAPGRPAPTTSPPKTKWKRWDAWIWPVFAVILLVIIIIKTRGRNEVAAPPPVAKVREVRPPLRSTGHVREVRPPAPRVREVRAP